MVSELHRVENEVWVESCRSLNEEGGNISCRG
jgi:hypothetical protein